MEASAKKNGVSAHDDASLLRPKDMKKAVDCASAEIAAMQGYNCENLRRMERDSGARIRCVAEIGHSGQGRVFVEGSSAAVEKGVAMVETWKGHREERVDCPRVLIGKIIGRSGERIKEIRDRSGAQIQVDQTTDPCVVEIAGSKAAIDMAKELVEDCKNSRYAAPQQTQYQLSQLAAQYTMEDPYKNVDEHWYSTVDAVGRVYWYNATTQETQWEPPAHIAKAHQGKRKAEDRDLAAQAATKSVRGGGADEPTPGELAFLAEQEAARAEEGKKKKTTR